MKSYGKYWVRLAALTTATVFQAVGLPTSCVEFTTLLGTQALNVCGVFNCEGGQFFDFCEPTVIFYDCVGP